MDASSQNLLVALFGAASVVWLLSFSNEKCGYIIYKLKLFTVGFLTMVLSGDARFPKQPDPEIIYKKETRTKRVIFIRHGESDWNEVFNRGFGPSFFVRLVKAIIREITLVITGDSIFVDSSLSELGMSQAREMKSFIEAESQSIDGDTNDRLMLKGETSVSESVIVCSNLRRAIATAAIGLQHRCKNTNEKINMMSSLQEISRNIDANAIAPPQAIPDLHVINKEMWPEYKAENLFDVSLNSGNKPIFGNGMERMKSFLDWSFARDESTIIVGGGHSLYFKSFFKNFLPFKSEHISKSKKMVNCGIVAFNISVGSANGCTVYRIDPESVTVIHGGFSK